jgi:hypothetical protein
LVDSHDVVAAEDPEVWVVAGGHFEGLASAFLLVILGAVVGFGRGDMSVGEEDDSGEIGGVSQLGQLL